MQNGGSGSMIDVYAKRSDRPSILKINTSISYRLPHFDLLDILGRRWTQVWTYNTLIDIANNGMPVRLLIWQGYGVSTNGAPCGGDAEGGPWDSPYSEQRAFVLTSDGKAIDEQRTRELFGLPATTATKAIGHANGPGVISGLPPGATPFKPLADSIGILGYGGKYYMQTENKPGSRGATPSSVTVILNDHGHTSSVCTFHPEAVPIPK